MRAVIVIPTRLAAARFPNKPLHPIAGLPMIVQVMARAREADLGPVWVAAGDAEIAAVVGDHGGRVVVTPPDLPSGSDRVELAMAQIDPDGRYGAVINLQGDLPAIPPRDLRTALDTLAAMDTDIATLAAEITDSGERDDPNVVKAVLDIAPGASAGRALYFSRAPVPSGPGPLYHHIGVYAFRRSALSRFVNLPPSPLERREKLEQLRALGHGLRIDAGVVPTVPVGVDTPQDVARAEAALATLTPVSR